MECDTCHDPHEVTANDWKDPFTRPGLKKQCQDCHKDQASFFAKNTIHGGNSCTSCHMPVMGSCENFAAIQYPDQGGFDTQRASHIWKILVDPDAKTMNPPAGKDRNFRGGSWMLAKKDGKPFIDLQWSCGRTSWGDPDLAQTGGCHSPVMSQLPKDLHFTDQKMIYNKVVGWQKPVKDGLEEVKATLDKFKPALDKTKVALAAKAQAQLMANQATDIITSIEKDHSWGVHAPAFTLQKVKEAKLLADAALASLSPGRTQAKK